MPPPGELSHIQDGFDGFFVFKAPAWVKEIGIAALVVGIFWTLYGLIVYFVSLILRVIHKPRI